MAFKKYQKAESHEVIGPDEQGKIQDNLHKVGKTSASDLNDDERRQVLRDLNDISHE